MNNAVIYARYSSQGQNEQTIDGQIRICQEYAANMGFNVIKVYADKARSGTNDSRPEFQRMIKDAVSESFQYVIVYMLDRFARNRRDSILYKEMLSQHNIKVISATQQISDDEGGEFYEMFLEWNDEKYSKRLSKRVRIGLDTSVANGTFTGGHLIYGYKLVDTEKKGVHRVVIDEQEAANLRYAFNEYANGVSKNEIAQALNARGERYHGKLFTWRTFEKYFVNRKYTGKFAFGERTCDKQYPPIIDETTFEKVQKRLIANKNAAGTKHALEPYLLTGKAFCGYCGTPMVADGGKSKTGQKYFYYVCKKKHKNECHKTREDKDRLEYKVTVAVQDFLSDENNAKRAAQNTIDYYENRTSDYGLKSIETRIANTTAKIAEMTNAFIEAKNPLLRLGIEKKMDEYQILLSDLQKQKSQILLERGRRYTVADILDYIAKLIKGDPNDKVYQKDLIDNLVLDVLVFDDGVAPTLNIGADKSVIAERNQRIEKLIKELYSVREQTPSLRQSQPNPNPLRLGSFYFN